MNQASATLCQSDCLALTHQAILKPLFLSLERRALALGVCVWGGD